MNLTPIKNLSPLVGILFFMRTGAVQAIKMRSLLASGFSETI
jgi:hypothetical protein